MPELTLRGRRLERDRAFVMAIVNRTPDSFYDRGATFGDESAMAAVERAVAEGADLVDIGGVKAGPGNAVDTTEEIRRVVPFIAAIREAFPALPISVDTWRSDVGREACLAGADLINDTWAGADGKLVEVAAEFGAGYVCSHTGGAEVRTRPFRVSYPHLTETVIADVTTLARHAVDVGVPREGVLIDPTHDFGKNTWHSIELLRHTRDLVDTGWPVLMALSNKDFVAETLDVELTERVDGTLAATALAANSGATMFRVHEVKRTRHVLEMVATIEGTRPPARCVRGLA
ncbi:dihydropteroate synthase [Amycolatopsis rhabdoformis]|uniref:Dihydropteroate synthase n=1 Tax=Amycolatopsis rhabdoformis TaxID=1448059 RepID=A0ABZ1IEL4_9PSEU|nr:dihydropteroate synthase [Amycolatopsis rhabdoformis]WSE32593.1 dihydropteroate synthase [Amycolatopsis rhabdoformis]